MMNLQLIATYFLIFTSCLTTIYISFRLYEKYRLKYLYFYLYYIIIHNILGFFYLFGVYINNQLPLFSLESKNLVTEISGFLIFPFIPVMLFMFINFIIELLNERFSNILKKVFLGLWGILILVYMFVAGRFFITGNYSLLREIRAFTYLLEGVILLGATFYLLIKARKVMNNDRRQAILIIGLMYFLILVFYIVIFIRLINPTLSFFLVLHFSYNIPPLVYMGMYLKKYQAHVSLPISKEANLDHFFEKYNITPREREVIMLLLKGKKTKDIEKELFISYHTAKNHIHNIFQKLSVQNRLQLTHLIRDFGSSQK